MSLTIKAGGSPVVVNRTMTLANTEYSVVFDKSIKKLLLQARGNSDIKLCFVAAGSGTTYFTLKASAVYFEDGITGPLTVYMQSGDAGVVVELITWSALD